MIKIFQQLQKLKQKIINWCDNVETISVGDLHTLLSPNSVEIYNNNELKFIESGKPVTPILIKTPTGFSKIKNTYKTVKYQKYVLTLEDNLILECADDHIVIDSYNNQRFVKDLTTNDKILTLYGPKQVISVKNTEEYENMYDIEIDDDNHLYYTNDIVSHNTETSCAFLLWWAIFKEDQTILVASNKSTNAMEIISKIQYAYEELPNWLKPGIDDSAWNKHTCTFDNKSRIISTTTSEDSGRGLSISLLYCDEFAFVKPFIADKFFDSIFPTISTGGSMIISSTPNGDIGKFAELWRGAQANINEFSNGVTYVPWNAPPGRDDKFKKQMIEILGERKWRQEFECEFLGQESTLIDSSLLTQAEVVIKDKINSNELIKLTLQDKFNFYKKLQKDGCYLVGVDPNTGSGRDNGCIQVFEFPSMEQVLEYATNTLSPQVMYTELKSILNFLNHATSEVYFSVENNGVGVGILAAYEGDENPPTAQLISHGKLPGVNSNIKTKLKACIQFKEAFERGKITINSIDLIKELKSFVRVSGGTYSAQTGSTDDRVMGCIIIFYIIQEMSRANGHAYDMVYTVASEIEERHGWKVDAPDVSAEPETRSEFLDKFFDSLHGINEDLRSKYTF